MPAKKLSKAEKDAVIEATMHKINTSAKHRVIARAEDVENVFFLRRPSGIIQLDIDTGGGLPAGGCCYITGPEGAGKTFLLCKYFAMQQRLYGPECRLGLATVEFPPDHLYMRKVGVQVAVPDRRIEEEAEYRKYRGLPKLTKKEVEEWKTQIGRVDVITGANQEETMNAVLSLYKTKAYNMIGVDSISAMLPQADADKTLDEATKRAASASVMTEFFHHYHPATLGLDGDANETTLALIAQVRSNSKKAEAASYLQRYMKDWAATGAWASRHGKLVDITVWSGEKIKEGTKEGKTQVGKYLNWEITKGKAGTHDGITGEVPYYFSSFVDEGDGIFIAGHRYAVVQDAEKGSVVIVRQGTGEVLAGPITKADFLDKLSVDIDFRMLVSMEIYAAAGIQCRLR